MPKGKAKFAAGKKGGLRPALVRQKSSTVVGHDEEEDDEEDDETAEAKIQIVTQKKPVMDEIAKIEEKKPGVAERKSVMELPKSVAKVEKSVVEVKKPVVEKAPVVERKPVLEVVSDIAEEGDEFEDEDEPMAAPPPMRRTTSAGPALGGKKTKKGSSTRLSKKNRNVSANAGRAAPGLGIAAALGGPGTKKEVEAPAPLPVVSIVEPDFRRKFQERNNVDNTSSKRREKLVFLTSDMEARTVKSQATVSIATPTSSVAVAKMIHGQGVLVVETGEIRGLNTQRAPVATGKVQIDNVTGVEIGGSGPAAAGGSRKSTLSLMIEDAKRKNGGKVGGGLKGSASLGGN